jgi:hypothetical protein
MAFSRRSEICCGRKNRRIGWGVTRRQTGSAARRITPCRFDRITFVARCLHEIWGHRWPRFQVFLFVLMTSSLISACCRSVRISLHQPLSCKTWKRRWEKQVRQHLWEMTNKAVSVCLTWTFVSN